MTMHIMRLKIKLLEKFVYLQYLYIGEGELLYKDILD